MCCFVLLSLDERNCVVSRELDRVTLSYIEILKTGY
jgi:hypothetical protein